MDLKERQSEIIKILEKNGYVTVKYLTEVLLYSTATINRDLNELARKQLVTRSYGGVELVRSTYVPIFLRNHKMHTIKNLIGKKAATFVNDGDTIYIDGSTTAQYMEKYLVSKKDITVITNNIVLAANLSANNVKVICLGGTIVEPPSMLFGDETVENSTKYIVDKMFFSTKAVTTSGIISSTLYALALNNLMKNAKEVYYLVDDKKINLPFNDIFCDFNKIDKVISNFEFADETKNLYPTTTFIKVNDD